MSALVSMFELMERLGAGSPAELARRLDHLGVHYFDYGKGRARRITTTVDALNDALGLKPTKKGQEIEPNWDALRQLQAEEG